MDTTARSTCPACDAPGMKTFVEIDKAAVLSNVLWEDRLSALSARRAKISLGFCGQCGMLYNLAFDPDLLTYTRQYENALDYSPKFRDYADQLARRLVRTYALHGKDVIEIGCGDGTFLSTLALLGNNRAVGYDPSYDRRRVGRQRPAGVTIRPEYYGGAHADEPADLVCCRHVLEHIPDPYAFLREVRAAVVRREGAAVYFEVPNALFSLRDLSIWDIIYEHCSYFTAESLGRLFIRAGFEPTVVAEQFGGQFLGIEARPLPDGSDPAPLQWSNGPDFGEQVRRFQQAYDRKVHAWRSALDEMAGRSAKVVVWGAGSKGISFLNVLGVSWRRVAYVVDLNPRKHGRFLTGTGQQIVAPEFLGEYVPDAVIIMNPIYRDEIGASLRRMGLQAEVHVA